MRSRFTGSVLDVRAVEDSIRATRKYTKGAFRRRVQHPVQGADFPSRVITEYYEVYPHTDIGWDMRASDAWAWVWGDVVHVDLWFHYDYVRNLASLEVAGGDRALHHLAEGIPGFAAGLEHLEARGNGRK